MSLVPVENIPVVHNTVSELDYQIRDAIDTAIGNLGDLELDLSILLKSTPSIKYREESSNDAAIEPISATSEIVTRMQNRLARIRYLNDCIDSVRKGLTLTDPVVPSPTQKAS